MRRTAGLVRAMLGVLLAMALAAAPVCASEEVDLAALAAPIREAVQEAQRNVQTLQRAAASEATLGDAYGQLGALLHAHELLPAALANYRRALALVPARGDLHYLHGVAAHAAGLPEEALAAFEHSLQTRPAYPPTQIRRARILAEQGRFEPAETALRAALAVAPQSPAAHAELGKVLLQAGSPQAAVDHLQQALALEPEANQLHYSLGLAYRALGRIDEALEQMALRGERQARMRDPLMAAVGRLSRSPQYFYELALDQLRSGNHANAASAFGRAASLDPGQALYARQHARQLAHLGQLELARAEAQRALALDPATADAHRLLGQIAEIGGDDAAAVSAYRAALARAPDELALHDLLARALVRLGQLEAAAEQYATLARLQAPGARAYGLYRQGLLALVQGSCEQAELGLGVALEASGGSDASILMALARTRSACLRQRDTQSLESARRVYAAAPGVESAETLAMVLAAAGAHAEAVELQTQAIFESLKGAEGTEVLQRRPELQANLERYRRGEPAAAALTLADPLLQRARLRPGELRAESTEGSVQD